MQELYEAVEIAKYFSRTLARVREIITSCEFCKNATSSRRRRIHPFAQLAQNHIGDQFVAAVYARCCSRFQSSSI